MANNTSGNPWIIDTASGTAITTDLCRVKGVRWTGATTAGHTAVIQDASTREWWSSVASGANYVEADTLYQSPGLNVRGIIVPTLASGRLFIEFI